MRHASCEQSRLGIFATIPVGFNTFHPQGMVKIGDTFYVSSVDIQTPTKRYPQLQDGYDRDTGTGIGHPRA